MSMFYFCDFKIFEFKNDKYPAFVIRKFGCGGWGNYSQNVKKVLREMNLNNFSQVFLYKDITKSEFLKLRCKPIEVKIKITENSIKWRNDFINKCIAFHLPPQNLSFTERIHNYLKNYIFNYEYNSHRRHTNNHRLGLYQDLIKYKKELEEWNQRIISLNEFIKENEQNIKVLRDIPV